MVGHALTGGGGGSTPVESQQPAAALAAAAPVQQQVRDLLYAQISNGILCLDELTPSNL